MVVLLVASSWLLCFPLIVQAMDGGDDTLCKDSLTPYDQTDGGTCTFVAVMIGYFGLAMSFGGSATLCIFSFVWVFLIRFAENQVEERNQ